MFCGSKTEDHYLISINNMPSCRLNHSFTIIIFKESQKLIYQSISDHKSSSFSTSLVFNASDSND